MQSHSALRARAPSRHHRRSGSASQRSFHRGRMKKVIAVIVLTLSPHARLPATLAAASPDSGPCAPLPAASSPGFEPLLEAFMNAFCYQKQNWQHDAQIRTSDGVHPYVKVWYSPSLWDWLTVSGRAGNVPDGAILVNEQYVSLPPPLHHS